MIERGKYVVIEGNDGTGKSIQATRLRSYLSEMGINVAPFKVEEPDGAKANDESDLAPAATELRKIIKDGSMQRPAWANVVMFMGSRIINWEQVMQPALEKGLWVVTTRNWLSTVAYQGYGEGMDIPKIERRVLEDMGEQYMKPDLQLILTLGDHTIRQARVNNRGPLETLDTFESKPVDFQDRVNHGYIDYGTKHAIPIVDASGTEDEVELLVRQHVLELV
ncbi:dTMP kinase [Pedobacter sp.]|nr:dTMP kinase [Candidatus Saccharibacteria bacterium]